MILNGIFKRLRAECRHLTNKKWSLEDVGRHWDETLHYDDINENTDSYFRRFTDSYKIYDLPKNSHILDICCRTGNGTSYFASKGKIKSAMCADVSERMLDICTKKLIEEGINFKTKRFKTLRLPFNNEEFDVILCFETIEHIAEPDIFIKELGRVVKRDGEMILTTPNILWEPVHSLAAIFDIHHSEGPHKFIGRYKLHRYIKDAGFDILKEKTTVLIPNGPKFLIKFGESIEKYSGDNIMNLIGLRRIFICKKI